MDQHVERRIVTQRAEDLQRLANRAERDGVVIYVEPLEGRHYATSRRDATRLYRVTPSTCDCPGFAAWGRCGHVALLVSQLGWVPDPVEAAPLPPVAVVTVSTERVNELTERRHRAAQARRRLAERAIDPGAAERARVLADATRIGRCQAAGISLVAD